MDKRPNILLVEDIETDIKILEHAFKKAEFDCNLFKVESAQDGWDYLLSRGKYKENTFFHKPDIVILDIKMPGIDGLDFVREIRKHDAGKNIPIIVFTTVKDMEEEFAKEGISDYIIKSISAKDLITRIKDKLNIS